MISKNILAEIDRRANKMKISDAELYLSNEFQEYAETLVQSVLGKEYKHIVVHTRYDDGSDVAFTNGDSITINMDITPVQENSTHWYLFLKKGSPTGLRIRISYFTLKTIQKV